MSDSEEVLITINTDDRLFALIEANIRHTSHEKTPDNVIRAITLLASGYSRAASAKLTGISVHNLNRWQRETWYKEATILVKERLDEELDSAYTAIIHKGAAEVVDRLDNGDWVFDKAGNKVRKPISGREAMLITGIAHDKRNLGRGKPTTISETVSTDDRLTMLAERFKSMTTVDGQYEEVIEDEASLATDDLPTNQPLELPVHEQKS